MLKGILVVAILMAVGTTCGGLIAWGKIKDRNADKFIADQSSLFMAHLDVYSNRLGLIDLSQRESPYIAGKVVVVGMGEIHARWISRAGKPKGSLIVDTPGVIVDQLQFTLPKELQASTPEEVGTFIWLEWHENIVGRYTEGGPARQLDGFITIIDGSRNAKVGKSVFHGAPPPKRTRGPTFGTLPLDDIYDYIVQLPRR